MIFTLAFVTKALIPQTISPGVAGAWVGTSEFADAAGFAVVAELATRHGDAPVHTFTLMKVIGRDIWIGIWAARPLDSFGRLLGAWEEQSARYCRRDGYLGEVPEVRLRFFPCFDNHELDCRFGARGSRGGGASEGHLQIEGREGFL